jgi:serine phosphatase RsbU (regulator of sigma subunit)/DNA-binding FadR family transcriptional regulator
MVLSNGTAKTRETDSSSGRHDRDGKRARIRLAGEICNGRYRPGQSLRLSEIAAQYQLDDDLVVKTFAEFQALGMVTLSSGSSATVRSPSPKEMLEAYEIRAALEEIAGRAAAPAFKGDTSALQHELDAMRHAFRGLDLDALAEHDVAFHRTIMRASQNKVLLRVWDSLAIDLRIRGAIGRVAKDIPEVIESHRPIIDALGRGQGREAGMLLRNHVETLLEFLKKSESDSGAQRALRRDLEGAKDVQEAFFPPRTLSIPCISCETFYQPAHGIGGDYYDLLSLPDGRWGMAIGDVSGKGIGAALLMASLQASLRAQALHPHLDLSALIGDVNRLVYESSPAHLFASLFYAEYEPSTRTLKYVNAGHNPPLVLRWRNGSCDVYQLNAGGIPVGIDADSEFSSTTFQLETGDVLVAYTDGITEADNRDGELWGMQRLENLLRSCDGATSQEVIDRILNEVTAFANGQRQRDDVTLVVMSVQEGCDA